MNTIVKNEEQTVQAPPAVAEPEREYIRPSVNIFETEDGYVLEAELPGVNKEGLSVNLQGNLLTVEGRRAALGMPNAEPLYRESVTADFRRVFQLDPAIDTGKISARIEQGILTLTLPRAEEAKPRKITVG